ncbi:MAG TPA: hypothetical protein PK408_00150 [Treponemataceae bacterium]|nr:hypothetical protein [Treponemataceae bacterium]
MSASKNLASAGAGKSLTGEISIRAGARADEPAGAKTIREAARGARPAPAEKSRRLPGTCAFRAGGSD